jgi:DNA-binding phage protein
MTQIARQTGLSRESLYKALSCDRSPSFDTVLKVIAALGLKLSAGDVTPFIGPVLMRVGGRGHAAAPC